MKREFTGICCMQLKLLSATKYICILNWSRVSEFCPGLCLSGQVKLPFCLDPPLQPPCSFVLFFPSYIQLSHICAFSSFCFLIKNLLTFVFLFNDSCSSRLNSGDCSSGEPPLVFPFPQAWVMIPYHPILLLLL